jgi:hypothetical protein
MGHFFAVVLVPSDTADIETSVEAFMARYEFDRPEFMTKCWCLTDGTPLPDCGSCAGTAEYNPNTMFEYYAFGGHYDGQVGNKRIESDFSFAGVERSLDPRHKQLRNNCVRVADIHDKQIRCFALITPDGKWHASAEDVWSPELTAAEDRRWRKKVERLLIQHSDCFAVGLDCRVT